MGDEKAGARDPHNCAGGEAGSRKFSSVVEKIICDRVSLPTLLSRTGWSPKAHSLYVVTSWVSRGTAIESAEAESVIEKCDY